MPQHASEATAEAPCGQLPTTPSARARGGTAQTRQMGIPPCQSSRFENNQTTVGKPSLKKHRRAHFNTMNEQSFEKVRKDDQMKKQKPGRILDIKHH